MVGHVLAGGDTSAPFKISNGVKRGCVLAPVLFNLFFTCVLNHALKDLDRGIYIKYRLNGSLFDLSRLRAKTKRVERLVTEALFADDCALMAHTEVDLQLIVSKFAEASQLFGFTISLGKTDVLYQPSPASTVHDPPTILIGDTDLKTVEHFKYLGSVISSDCSLDREISTRINKTSQALGRLRTRVMNHKSIKLPTKIKVYTAIVLTSLLYGCETWTLYRKHIKQLERFHMRALRSIMGIKWQDRVTNLEVLDRATLASIETMVLKAQLRWTGHVIRMEPFRLPRQLLYGELRQGQKPRGRPKKRFKDCIKNNLKHSGTPSTELENLAQDRSAWGSLTRQAQEIFETNRRDYLTSARERRKASTPSLSTTATF